MKQNRVEKDNFYDSMSQIICKNPDLTFQTATFSQNFSDRVASFFSKDISNDIFKTYKYLSVSKHLSHLSDSIRFIIDCYKLRKNQQKDSTGVIKGRTNL